MRIDPNDTAICIKCGQQFLQPHRYQIWCLDCFCAMFGTNEDYPDDDQLGGDQLDGDQADDLQPRSAEPRHT